MNIVIAGGYGQLGTALGLTSPTVAHRDRIARLGRSSLDITDPVSDRAMIETEQPDLIINAAAYTAVDRAEAADQRTIARAVNAEGAANLATAAAKARVPLIHVSTDYVYGDNTDGVSVHHEAPYCTVYQQSAQASQTPLPIDAPAHPRSVYGSTKLAGDYAVQDAFENIDVPCAIVRTSWVYSGAALPEHRDFVSTMMRLERQSRGNDGPAARVVNDQWGSPTNVFDLARGLWELSGVASAAVCFPEMLAPGGVVHCVGEGACTWWDVACRVFTASGGDPGRVVPVPSQEYPTPAERPSWSVLDNSSWLALGLTPLPAWQDGVDRAVGGVGV